jgi:zinc protease
MIRILSLSILCSWLVVSPMGHVYAQTFPIESTTLKNGMQVVVIPNHRAPVVSHMVWYKVGSADEPQGDSVSGAAHFLEHLMFKGTRALEPGQFSKFIRSLGGQDNAFTSWDFTAYFQSVAKEHLPRMMALEADRMMNITLPQNEIDSEREVIIEERRSRTDNDPQSLFSEQIRSTLFLGTPYAEPIIGWRDEMPLLNRTHVEHYYRTWYAPNNAILVISGDVTMDEVKPLAERYFSIIPSFDVPEHIRPIGPQFPAPTIMNFTSEDIHQPVFIRAWRVPSKVQNKQEALALEVLAETLSGGSSTELYQSLVVNKKMASDISLSYSGDFRGEGSMWLYATPAPNIDFDTLEKNIQKKMSELIGNGIKSVDIQNAKKRLIDSGIYARDSVMGPAMIVGQALAMGLSLEDIQNRDKLIEQISDDDVAYVFKKYLHPETPFYQPVTGLMSPKKDMP